MPADKINTGPGALRYLWLTRSTAQIDEETGVLLPRAAAIRAAWGLSRTAGPPLGIAGTTCQSRRQSREARAL